MDSVDIYKLNNNREHILTPFYLGPQRRGGNVTPKKADISRGDERKRTPSKADGNMWPRIGDATT